MDEDVKKEFEKIWDKIRSIEGSFTDKPITDGDQKTYEGNIDLDKNISAFCKNNGLDEKKLRYEVDFQDQLPRLINVPKENARTKLQLNTLLSLSFLIYRVYGRKLSESLIRGLFDLNHVPVDRMDKLYVSPDFKRLYSKSGTEIKLSWAGEKESIRKIKELLSKNETNTSK